MAASFTATAPATAWTPPAGGPQLLPMDKLGAHEVAPGKMTFGIFLPGISEAKGYLMTVKILHEKDQFLQEIRSNEFPLTHSADADYGDYWNTPTPISIDPASKTHVDSHWGTKGTYVYRYVLYPPGNRKPIDWVIDPFAREFGVGKMSAFTLGYEDHTWSAAEATWKTPKLNDLVVYELMINEFGGDIAGTISHLHYLHDLGVNCIEVMPVSNVSETVDWGYGPLGHFGVDERFGNRRNFQELVDAAHQCGMAVMLDAVYSHTGSAFPYRSVYEQLGFPEGPFGPFVNTMFGLPKVDFHSKFAQDFFFTVNNFWLDRYHVDGFRYDFVPSYWNGPLGVGYGPLTYWTYQRVKAELAAGTNYWHRFAGNNLIQCAEQLEKPIEILNQSYSTCTWQNGTMDAACSVAKGSLASPPQWDAVTWLASAWGLFGYPTSVSVNGDVIPKTALQYLENHDHSRFLCNFGLESAGENEWFARGERSVWYKLQPYIIGLAACKGIPLIYQGEEFGDNYALPNTGTGRVRLFRPAHWEYFYDDNGQSLIRLFRKVLAIRAKNEHLRSGEHYFYNNWKEYQSKGVMLFSRYNSTVFSLIALNFSGVDQVVPFWFPKAGNYLEELHGLDNLENIPADIQRMIRIPSNYGRIWTSF